MAQLKTISIYGKNKKTREGKGYVEYSYTKDGKVFYRIAFKKTAKNYPVTETGYIKITFDSDLIGKPKKGATYTKKDGTLGKQNDIIYLDGVLAYIIDEEKNAESSLRQQEAVNDLFE